MTEITQKKHTFDFVLNVFAWLSFFVAIFLAVAVLLSTFSGTDDGKSIFGYKMLIVKSDSMSKSDESINEPIFFSTGDLIVIKEVGDASTIAVGDVITFVSHNPDSVGKTISHKVRSIVRDGENRVLGFETYGIYTGESDRALVDPSTVMGKYVTKSVILGKAFTFFKTPAGYFTSILTPCVLLIIFFSIKVGMILAKREMHGIYYKEFSYLKERIEELKTNKGDVVMQKEENVVENQVAPSEDSVKLNAEQIPSGNVQSIIQMQNNNEKVLEIMATTLANTIQSLTKTIDTLASTVGKPVDTLARSVETLATANAKPTVVEKIIEKPVVQTVVKEVPVIKEVIVQPENKVVEEITATQEPVKDDKPVIEVPQIEETDTGSIFDEFAQREKIPFNKKLLSLNTDVKEYFAEVHNELISYKKVNYRISFKSVSYRVGRKTLAKIVVRGKTLKLHLALDVNAFSKTIFFQEDLSGVKAYEDVPFAVKIKSDRAKNNALKLINSLAENNALIKDEQFKKENILKELKQYK